MKIRKNILVLFLLLFTVSLVWAQAEQAKSIAVVLVTKGDAETKKGDGKWDKLKFGAVLDDGDRIRTGDDGFVALVFTDDKSQVKIRPNSEITVNASRNPDYSMSKSVNVQIGELFADVTKQKGSFRVATPTSVASVKGTEFWVLVDENGETQVLTTEGIIELLSLITGETRDVIQGIVGTVAPDGSITIGDIEITNIPELPPELQNPQTIRINFIDENGNQKQLIIEYNNNEE